MPVSRETAAWGMRLILGVEPGNDAELDRLRTPHASLEAMRASLFGSDEARAMVRAAGGAGAAEGFGAAGAGRFSIPPFLLRRPVSDRVPWRFAEPSLAEPTSQLCTGEQMRGELYGGLCRRLGLDPASMHRKAWEFAYIMAVLEAKGMLRAGRRGIGFGVGREPLPSALAAMGVDVLATDRPGTAEENAVWSGSGQWARSLEEAWMPALVSRDAFFERVRFDQVDLRAVPEGLGGFDFCWSACCVETLGSIGEGLDAVRGSLAALRPGGLAIHTTQFNLGSDDGTLEMPSLVVFRKQDVERVMAELVEGGHEVAALNLWPGTTEVDEHVDLPPFGLPHLKLRLEGHLTTTIGIVVTKGG